MCMCLVKLICGLECVLSGVFLFLRARKTDDSSRPYLRVRTEKAEEWREKAEARHCALLAAEQAYEAYDAAVATTKFADAVVHAAKDTDASKNLALEVTKSAVNDALKFAGASTLLVFVPSLQVYVRAHVV